MLLRATTGLTPDSGGASVRVEALVAGDAPPVQLEVHGELAGDPVAVFRLADAPLMCRADGSGRFGVLLVTLDPERFLVADDLAPLYDVDLELRGLAEAADGSTAEGTAVVTLLPP